MVALKSIARRILRLDGTEVPLMSQPQLEFFSGKNFVKPNAFKPHGTRARKREDGREGTTQHGISPPITDYGSCIV
jgi:hypothetical protein